MSEPSETELTEPRRLEPLTEGEWKRLLHGWPMRVLVKPEQLEYVKGREVWCSRCPHARKQVKEPWRGYCLEFRLMVSDNFPKLCRPGGSR